MVTVHANGDVYSVVFAAEEVSRIGKRGFEEVLQTRCAIFNGDMRPKAIGYAHMNPSDIAIGAKGAEVALGRALQVLTKDKEVRAKFWVVFWKAIKATEELEALDDVIDAEPVVIRRTAEQNARVTELKRLLEYNKSCTYDCFTCDAWKKELADLEAIAA